MSFALIPILFVVGGVSYTASPRGSRDSVAILCTLLIAAAGFMTFVALLMLTSELLRWRGEVRLAEDHARRRAAQLRHQTTTPPATVSHPTAEEMASDLLRNALAKRGEALREADRIARTLNVIYEELSDEQQE